MLDISTKTKTLRSAKARGVLRLKPETIDAITNGKSPKGDPLPIAKAAAIMAAKNTSQIIPYCHPIAIDFVGVEFETGVGTITVTCTVKAIDRTGVEMEALTAASVALLTIYDMTKMLDESMEIGTIHLIEKRGGKSEFKETFKTPLKAAVLVMSDSIAGGKKSDLSGRLIVERLEREELEVVDYAIIPDDTDQITQRLLHYADTLRVDLVMTTGGTGFSPRDFSPEATRKVIEREIPGISEAIRAYGQTRTPYSMLSRGVAGIRGSTIIINLPGSKKGVAESLDALFPALLHSFKMLRSGGHTGAEAVKL